MSSKECRFGKWWNDKDDDDEEEEEEEELVRTKGFWIDIDKGKIVIIVFALEEI